MEIYKLSDENGCTKNDTQWGENVTHTASGPGNTPCSQQVIHSYLTPEIASFSNPIHGDYRHPICWLAEGDVTGCDGQKLWGKSVTTLRQVPLPEITTEQRVEIAIRISLVRYREKSYVEWAEKWLSEVDRSGEAASRAARASRAAAANSAWAWAARAASRAATATAEAAAASRAAEAEADNEPSFCIGLHLLICSVIYR